MKMLLIKSGTLALIIFAQPIHAQLHQANYATECSQEQLITESITESFDAFEQSIGLFKQQLSGLIDQNSKEKLQLTCTKLRTAIDKATQIFINPIRNKVASLQNKSPQEDDCQRFLKLLLAMSDELKKHFDTLHATLSKSLSVRKPSAVQVAKDLKPVVDRITADQNFAIIDNYLAQVHAIAQQYDIVITIKPEYHSFIQEPSRDGQPRTNVSSYNMQLAEAIHVIREGLKVLHAESKTSALSPGELLRMIRKRL